MDTPITSEGRTALSVGTRAKRIHTALAANFKQIACADMSRDIIKLQGYKHGKDIEIKYTGLRTGEKLHEELIADEENIQKTIHQNIMVLNFDDHKSLSDMTAVWAN